MHSAGHTILLPEEMSFDRAFAKTLYAKRDSLHAAVSTDPKLDAAKFAQVADRRKQIMDIADYYAVKVEREDPNDEAGLAKRITSAWEQLDTLNPLVEPIEHGHVIGVLRSLTYVGNQRHPHGYRTEHELQMGKRVCDNHRQMYSLMDSLLWYANAIDDPLEKALYIHIGVPHLQPGMNGNKRAAQLLSDKVLDKADFPIPFIPEEEHSYYTNLLYDAACEIDAHETGSKVSRAADYILQRISSSIDILKECSHVNCKDKHSIVPSSD